MVFNGLQPLVKRWDGNDPSLWSSDCLGVRGRGYGGLKEVVKSCVKILSTSSDDDGPRGDHEIEGGAAAGQGG